MHELSWLALMVTRASIPHSVLPRKPGGQGRLQVCAGEDREAHRRVGYGEAGIGQRGHQRMHRPEGRRKLSPVGEGERTESLCNGPVKILVDGALERELELANALLQGDYAGDLVGGEMVGELGNSLHASRALGVLAALRHRVQLLDASHCGGNRVMKRVAAERKRGVRRRTAAMPKQLGESCRKRYHASRLPGTSPT